MFHFFRKPSEPKKAPAPEREADGFVLLGDTTNEQRASSQNSPSEEEKPPSQRLEMMPGRVCGVVTDVPQIVGRGSQRHGAGLTPSPSPGADVGDQPHGSASGPPKDTEGQSVESGGLVVELLRDVPFTLAPHVLAAQGAVSDLPNPLLTSDVNDNLSRFLYDFTLENSVLCEP